MKKFWILALLFCFCGTFSANLFAEEAKKVFDGASLKGWKAARPNIASRWIVGRAALDPDNNRLLIARPLLKVDGVLTGGELINFVERNWNEAPQSGVDLCTEEVFGDCLVEIEFMVPRGANSGVYLMGEYEVQVLDSWGKETMTQGDVGAIYSAAPPSVNASRPPGEWQKFVIDFQAPRFDAEGNKTQNAKFLKVTLNDTVIQENVEVQGSTGGGITGREAPKGPLMLQGDHGPVVFRNIKVTEK